MSKTNEVRVQDATPKTVYRSTMILAISLTFFATVVATTIGNWFMYSNIHGDARAAVYQDAKALKDLK